jgi:hypothetical protein
MNNKRRAEFERGEGKGVRALRKVLGEGGQSIFYHTK